MSSTAHGHSLLTATRLLTLLIVLATVATVLASARPVIAAPVPGGTGFVDFSFGTEVNAPTEDKPQSKVWFNDGFWWGGLWNVDAGEHQIYKLVNQEWQSTGVAVDDRRTSDADYLWDGTSLYVASASGDTRDEPILVFKYTYDPAADTYTLDPAFVENQDADATLEEGRVAGQGRTESVTIAKDTTGQLWVTFTNDIPATTTRNVMVNRSTDNEHTWGTAFALPGAPVVSNDDISAIVAFGSSVGVMWTNQLANGGFGFSVHADASDDMTWGGAEVAASDAANPTFVDDHINLKASADGRVFAAVKTNDGPDHIQLLERATNGTWTMHLVVGEGIDATRPQVVLDGQNNSAYVFYTIPVLDDDAGDQTIYYKSAPLNDLGSFGTGNGAVFINQPGVDINDVSGPKHVVSTATGLLAIAAADAADLYYHGFLTPGAPVDQEPPAAPTGLQATPTSSTSVELTWTASTSGDVTAYGVYRNGALLTTVGGTSHTDTTVAAGTTYTYTVDAVDAAGNRSPQSAGDDATTPGTPPPPSGHPFTDVDGHQFESDIAWLYDAAITNGCTTTTFCPDNTVTRAEMATFLVRALGLTPSDTNHFDDDNGIFHERNINALLEAGITRGCNGANPRLFCPNDPVTREQMAAFLNRGYGFTPSSVDFFHDDDASFAEADIQALAAAGVTRGCSVADPGLFCTTQLVTRGQMAAFIHRAETL